MGRILLMRRSPRDLQTAYSGDIAAAGGPEKNTTTGDTLQSDDKHQILLGTMGSPTPS